MADTSCRKTKSAVRKKTTPKTRPATDKAEGPDKKRKGDSVATVLVRMALEVGVKLFHSPDGTAYATVPYGDYSPNLRLRNSAFASWLKRSYHRAATKTPGAQAVADAIGTLEGIALHDCPVENVHLRVADRDGRLYLDLADPRWRAVEIDATGWRIVDNPPVRFRRPRGMQPLPEPKRGGSLDQMRPFLNVASDDDYRLAVAWLLASLRPQGPYPLMVLSGQQGSSKSTTARVLRSLVDPSVAPIRCEPKEPRDLMIGANASWMLALDNLSSVPAWLSDALCRLSTGGGFSTRQLYTDDEEIIFDAQRPVILTSIEEVTTRGDLLERSLILSLPPIPEHLRRPEKDLWADFESKRPAILGALLDAVSGALRELPRVKLSRLPRMADFAVWATACERALHWPSGSFFAAYQQNQANANDVALESCLLTAPIQRLLESVPYWTGTATDLLHTLVGVAGEQVVRGRGWPKDGKGLSGWLKRLAPNLAAVGIVVEFHRDKRTRTISIKTTGGKTSSPASPASPHRENKAFWGDDSGDDPRPGDDAGDDLVTIPSDQNPLENRRNDAGDAGDDVSLPCSADIIAGAWIDPGPVREKSVSRIPADEAREYDLDDNPWR